MSVDLKIHLVAGHLVAFSIDLDLYFLRTLPVPQLFNSDLTPQIIPNIDSWFQAHTHQRYSYRGFCDMADAFAAGLAHSYSLQDLHQLCEAAVQATRNLLLTDRLGDYTPHFWIEILDPVRMETVYAQQLRENFDQLRRKLGDDRFYNNLCRLWKHANRHRPVLAAVFERLIQRLGRTPQEPAYPETVELDADLKKVVLQQVLDHRLGVYKGVPANIQHKLCKLEALEHADGDARGLQGS